MPENKSKEGRSAGEVIKRHPSQTTRAITPWWMGLPTGRKRGRNESTSVASASFSAEQPSKQERYFSGSRQQPPTGEERRRSSSSRPEAKKSQKGRGKEGRALSPSLSLLPRHGDSPSRTLPHSTLTRLPGKEEPNGGTRWSLCNPDVQQEEIMRRRVRWGHALRKPDLPSLPNTQLPSSPPTFAFPVTRSRQPPLPQKAR